MEARYLRVKNWDKFQHYHNRPNPPHWIKMYPTLLDDYKFRQLPELDRGRLLQLWLLAGRLRNKLPYDARYIAQVIGAKRVNLDLYVTLGWLEIIDENGVLLDPETHEPRSRPDSRPESIPELEVEGERETEEEKEHAAETAANVTALAVRKRDECWDFVVELKGEPLPRQRSGYGRIAADLRALLERDTPTDDWAAELRRRHRALAAQWGDDKATPRSLVENWQLAGRAANGALKGPKRDLTLEERMWNHATRGGELDAG